MGARFPLALQLLFLLLPPLLLCDKSTQKIVQFVRRAKTDRQTDKDNKGLGSLTMRQPVDVREETPKGS